ncbi:hypothetical protein RZS08_61575, partial [Arthrospira platensis SPKY1]|nr:hypothetical protein [Arthrospira platensis SPKY1]
MYQHGQVSRRAAAVMPKVSVVEVTEPSGQPGQPHHQKHGGRQQAAACPATDDGKPAPRTAALRQRREHQPGADA